MVKLTDKNSFKSMIKLLKKIVTLSIILVVFTTITATPFALSATTKTPSNYSKIVWPPPGPGNTQLNNAINEGGEKFNVQSILKADGQEHSYLKEGVKEKTSPVLELIILVINTALRLIGSISVLALVLAGYYLITAGGEEEGLNKGKNLIKLTITGLIITFSAYIIVTFVQSIFYQ